MQHISLVETRDGGRSRDRRFTARPPAAFAGVSPAQRMAGWEHAVEALRYAFQPIVHARTGRCHGVEALLRGTDGLGFADIAAFFRAAHEDGALPEVEQRLHAKAIAAFRALPGWEGAHLFLNVDGRAISGGDTVAPFRPAPQPGLRIVYEISENAQVRTPEGIDRFWDGCREVGAGIALDDFEFEYSWLKYLHKRKPEYVKIDRYYVSGIDKDHEKRSIVGGIVKYFHTAGILTVAEGVETEGEFYVCRDIGCEFLQGYLLGRPSETLEAIPQRNEVAETLNRNDRRAARERRLRLAEMVEPITPIRIGQPVTVIFDYFMDWSNPPNVPVVDGENRPLGLLRERDLKKFVYSKYGRDLLSNRSFGNRIEDLAVKCQVCDVGTSIERLSEAISEETAEDGVIITEGGSYIGFLSSRSLVRLLHERNVALATDQNPLTKLPGNNAIMRHIEGLLRARGCAHTVVYLDFDSFKPFNDTYGFRQGDRAILMFSERLKTLALSANGFAGHIGGDDFVLTLSGMPENAARTAVTELVATFRSDAESLYDAEARAAGGIVAKDRYGIERTFPLLSVSGVAVTIPHGAPAATVEDILAIITANKQNAKRSAEKVVFATPGSL